MPKRQPTVKEKAEELARIVAEEMNYDSTDGDAFAIASSLCTDTVVIDKSMRILGKAQTNEESLD